MGQCFQVPVWRNLRLMRETEFRIRSGRQWGRHTFWYDIDLGSGWTTGSQMISKMERHGLRYISNDHTVTVGGRLKGHRVTVPRWEKWLFESGVAQQVRLWLHFEKKKNKPRVMSCHVHWFYSMRKRKEERRGSGLGFKVRKDDITTPWNRAFIMVNLRDSQVLERNWV